MQPCAAFKASIPCRAHNMHAQRYTTSIVNGSMQRCAYNVEQAMSMSVCWNGIQNATPRKAARNKAITAMAMKRVCVGNVAEAEGNHDAPQPNYHLRGLSSVNKNSLTKPSRYLLLVIKIVCLQFKTHLQKYLSLIRDMICLQSTKTGTVDGSFTIILAGTRCRDIN